MNVVRSMTLTLSDRLRDPVCSAPDVSAGRVSVSRTCQSLPGASEHLNPAPTASGGLSGPADYRQTVLTTLRSSWSRPGRTLRGPRPPCSECLNGVVGRLPALPVPSRPTGARRRQRRDRRRLRDTWPALCRPDCLQSESPHVV